MGTENTNPPSDLNPAEALQPTDSAVLDVHMVPYEEIPPIDYALLAKDAADAAKRKLKVKEMDHRSEIAGLQEEIEDLRISIGGLMDPADIEKTLSTLEQRQKELLHAQTELYGKPHA